MITQLIFEHALRIRMISATHADVPAAPTDTMTPGDESSSSGNEGVSIAVESDVGAANATRTSLPTATSETPQPAPKAENLVGRINNLVTTDVQKIANARNIMQVYVSTPISIAVSVYFLYTLLGWRCAPNTYSI